MSRCFRKALCPWLIICCPTWPCVTHLKISRACIRRSCERCHGKTLRQALHLEDTRIIQGRLSSPCWTQSRSSLRLASFLPFSCQQKQEFHYKTTIYHKDSVQTWAWHGSSQFSNQYLSHASTQLIASKAQTPTSKSPNPWTQVYPVYPGVYPRCKTCASMLWPEFPTFRLQNPSQMWIGSSFPQQKSSQGHSFPHLALLYISILTNQWGACLPCTAAGAKVVRAWAQNKSLKYKGCFNQTTVSFVKVTCAYDLCVPKIQTKVETPTAMLSFAAFVRDFTIGICTLFKSISSFSCHFDQIAWSVYEREKKIWGKSHKNRQMSSKILY